MRTGDHEIVMLVPELVAVGSGGLDGTQAAGTGGGGGAGSSTVTRVEAGRPPTLPPVVAGPSVRAIARPFWSTSTTDGADDFHTTPSSATVGAIEPSFVVPVTSTCWMPPTTSRTGSIGDNGSFARSRGS